MASLPETPNSSHLLLPVLPLRDVCLFPEASLQLTVLRPPALRGIELAMRTGERILAIAQKDPAAAVPGPGGLHPVGTVARLTRDEPESEGRRIELDGLLRARVVSALGAEALVAEVETLEEGDPGDEWGGAVEALARYLHSHVQLRGFLDGKRRSKQPMAWVNLACQHLPITVTARQKLLESDAASRCLKIGRGLDALLRKEQTG